jgi:hypothetical protein
LRELWDVAIDVPRKGIGDFRIVADAGGSVIVAGGSGGLAQLVSLDGAGRAESSWMATAGPKAIDVGPYGLVLDDAGDVVLAGSHVKAQSMTNVQYQVRVRRLGEHRAQRGL